jgi:hypothetical protein
MAQYMFSAYDVEGAAHPQMTEEEVQQGWQKILVLEEEMKSAGGHPYSLQIRSQVSKSWIGSASDRTNGSSF